MTLESWMAQGGHLPEPMRDFHDAKGLFKTMHALQKLPDDRSPAATVDWITGQCYVVDRFLWFMARRGYTLQRSRAKVPFRDLAADIAEHERQMADSFVALVEGAAMSASTTQTQEPSND